MSTGKIGNPLEVCAAAGIELHDEIERGAPIEDPTDRCAGEACLDGFRDILGSEPLSRNRRPVQYEAHKGDVHLLLERQIDHSLNLAHRVPDVLAETAQRGEIIAEDLHRDVRTRARQHVIDAVRDRLTDRHVGARQRRETTAQIGQQFRARPFRVAQADVDFRGFHALDVLVQLGAAGSSRRGDDLGL